MTHVDNLRMENNVWKFTLKDGRKMRTGLLGLGVYEYSSEKKKYSLLDECKNVQLSVNRLTARRQINKLFGPIQSVRSIPEAQLDFGLGGNTKGRKSRGWYISQLNKLNNERGY